MGEKIILYSTGCPLCKQLEMFLNKSSISYEINNDQEYMLAEGFKKIPILEVNGIRMGYDEAKDWVKNREKVGAEH